MKLFFTFLLLCATLLSAQKTFIKPIGQAGPANEILQIKKVVKNYKGFKNTKPYDTGLAGITGVIDTLSWATHASYNVNFGFFGQDVMVQWFEAPTDMNIKAVSFTCTDDENTSVRVKLVSFRWDREQIQETQNIGATHWGYYEANGNGYNDVSPFEDDPETTGGWVEAGQLAQDSLWGSPFNAALWTDDGIPATAVKDEETWVQMSDAGFIPEVVTGEIFGVAIFNEGTVLDSGRTGLAASNSLGITGFKFYRNGRLFPGEDYGWWTRLYSWDITLAVELIGCRPPYIDVTHLLTTLSTAPRRVVAMYSNDNPSGGDTPKDSVSLNYWNSVSDEWVSVGMDSISPRTVEGYIPGYPPGTEVRYFCRTEYENPPCGNAESQQVSYHIFQPQSNTLLVMNGLGDHGFPTDYYFGHDDFVNFTTYPFDHDVWTYGPLTHEILANYTNVIEITTTGPNEINSDSLRNWLEDNGSHNYMLAGDEWLGAQTGWVDQDWRAGSFQYDILGITHQYNDINYDSSYANSNRLPSQLKTIAGSFLGSRLDSFTKHVDLDSLIGVDTLWYDPTFEIGVKNWLDGVDVTEDCDVFLKGVGHDSVLYNIGHSRVLPAGNKIAFFAYDPLSLNSSPYYWFGFSEAAPQVEVLKWFGVVIALNADEPILSPNKFSLSQNYPNPFNPETIINYELRIMNKVKLIVYDVLGREVKILVDKTQPAGKYKVVFNAANFASGVYYYKLKAGKDFEKTRKMLLLR
jgi:Secretion system C-terminal sorting domain